MNQNDELKRRADYRFDPWPTSIHHVTRQTSQVGPETTYQAVSSARPTISDAEWRVMHEIWQRQPVTSSELIDRLMETAAWSQGTIKTLLHRLVQKGVLDFQRKGNRYIYRSNFTEAECVDEAGSHLLHAVFHGRPLPMLTHLVHTARLSGSEVESLKIILNQMQQDLPKSAAEE